MQTNEYDLQASMYEDIFTTFDIKHGCLRLGKNIFRIVYTWPVWAEVNYHIGESTTISSLLIDRHLDIKITAWPENGSSQKEGYTRLGIKPWSKHMKTSSNGNIFRVTGPWCREFTGQRPVTRAVFFDLHLNKRLSKQSWGWWFETPSCSL